MKIVEKGPSFETTLGNGVSVTRMAKLRGVGSSMEPMLCLWPRRDGMGYFLGVEEGGLWWVRGEVGKSGGDHGIYTI